MSFEDIQNAWKHQAPVGRIKVERTTLMKLIKRDQKTLQKTLFRRDFLEVGTALILVPIWIWLGQSEPWTWYLAIPGCLWIAGFLIIDRFLQRRKTSAESDPLKKSIKGALAQVNHQIYLLKNVFWWYLLPLLLPLSIYFTHTGWLSGDLGTATIDIAFTCLLFFGIYKLNQRAIRKDLIPRRDELENFLISLNEPDHRAVEKNAN